MPIKTDIKTTEGLNFDNLTIHNYQNLIPPKILMQGINMGVTVRPKYIYRTRSASGQLGGLKTHHVSHYFARPDQTLNRCNVCSKVFQGPVFYGAPEICTTAFELKNKIESDMFVSCRNVGNNKLKLGLFTDPRKLIYGESKSGIDPSKIGSEQLLIYDYYDEIFCKDENRFHLAKNAVERMKALSTKNDYHALTAHIAYHNMFVTKKYNGIIYRSAQSQGIKGVIEPYDASNQLENYAIRNDWVEKKLKLSVVYKLRAEQFIDDKGTHRSKRIVLKVGYPDKKGKIIFHAPTSNEKNTFKQNHGGPSPIFARRVIEKSTYNPLTTIASFKIFGDLQRIDNLRERFTHSGLETVKTEGSDGSSNLIITNQYQNALEEVDDIIMDFQDLDVKRTL